MPLDGNSIRDARRKHPCWCIRVSTDTLSLAGIFQDFGAAQLNAHSRVGFVREK